MSTYYRPLKSNMDRFIAPRRGAEVLLERSLKSNMDRFIGKKRQKNSVKFKL